MRPVAVRGGYTTAPLMADTFLDWVGRRSRWIASVNLSDVRMVIELDSSTTLMPLIRLC